MSDSHDSERARIQALVAAECARIRDDGTREQLTGYLVTPRRHMLEWDYASEPTAYPAWLVADSGISYCEQGFGPRCPWGLTGLDGGSAGMDSGWFRTLHEAFLDSFAWEPREIILDPTAWQMPSDALSAVFDALRIPPETERSIESFAALVEAGPAGGVELPLQIFFLDRPDRPRELIDFIFAFCRTIDERLHREGFSIRLIPRWVLS
ncbi:hypothetical protein AB4Z01_34060 [Inquilinus sp. YAF38]|uniref:hypothetical protein n=1 Tax=Inquilinus sp. YAF38 TaxID=3233084 RepID=UPI003F9071FF